MKLHQPVGPSLYPGKRRHVSAKTRFLDFPWGTKVGWPLREIGVHVAGFDHLDGHFYGGTPASTTHLLYFVLSGQVECTSAFGTKVVQAGYWAACPAQTTHWIRHGRGKTVSLWVHLLDTPQWRFIRKYGAGIFPIHQAEKLRQSLLGAILEAHSLEYGAFEAALSFTRIYRVNLIREIDRAFQRDQSAISNRLAALWTKVNSCLEQEWTVNRMAEELKISPSACYKYVARHHGLKPMQMVTRMRIEAAKDLLLHSTDKLQAIAAKVGYQTAFCFSDAFRRETGLRPGRFRKSINLAILDA